MTTEELYAALIAIETSSKSTSLANSTDTGYWKRYAKAAETGAPFTPPADIAETEIGYMRRTALALESISGTNGLQENESYEGYLKRIVDALESKNGATYPGSQTNRFRLGSLALTFIVHKYLAYALAMDFDSAEYFVGGTQYNPLSTAPGYTFTRLGIQGAVDASGAVAFFAAGVPAINSKGYHAYGALTNLLLNAGSSALLATQTTAALTAVAHTISFIGTGSVALSGAFVGLLAGTSATDQVALTFTPTAAALTVTVTGDVRFAGLMAASLAGAIPIIATGAATASIGESLLKQNAKADGTALTDQDMLISVSLTPQTVTSNSFLLEINENAASANRLYIRIDPGNATGIQIFVAGAGVFSSGGAYTPNQKATFLLRRLAGVWRSGKVVAGVLTWYDAGTAAAFPSGMITATHGNHIVGTVPGQSVIAGTFIKPGTFDTDAKVLTAVAETA